MRESLVVLVSVLLVKLLLFAVLLLLLLDILSLQLHFVLSEVLETVVAEHLHEFAEGLVEALHGEQTPLGRLLVGPIKRVANAVEDDDRRRTDRNGDVLGLFGLVRVRCETQLEQHSRSGRGLKT